MDKILVDVYIPALMESYDIFIPSDIQMATVLDLIKKSIAEISDRVFVSSESVVICDFESGRILDINKSADELEIFNGSRLMLI